MAHTEIEPWAAKTLLLLRSSAENSLEDMRAMLMETIHQKYNGRKQYKMIPPLSGPITETIEKVKPKETRVSTETKPKSHPSPAAGSFSPSIDLISPDSCGSDSENSSTDNSEMVILEDDIPCTVCKNVSCTQWNQFVECAECHALYHQQCHDPPISDSDVSDPRTVWYCRNCTKTVSKPKPSSANSSSSSSKEGKNSSSKPTGRSSTSSPSFGSKTFGGGMSSSKKSVSSKSSSSSSSKVAPNINMVSADKRLQIMKKKAAKKQEKRPK